MSQLDGAAILNDFWVYQTGRDLRKRIEEVSTGAPVGDASPPTRSSSTTAGPQLTKPNGSGSRQQRHKNADVDDDQHDIDGDEKIFEIVLLNALSLALILNHLLQI